MIYYEVQIREPSLRGEGDLLKLRATSAKNVLRCPVIDP
jgi:hypothetical protein